MILLPEGRKDVEGESNPIHSFTSQSKKKAIASKKFIKFLENSWDEQMGIISANFKSEM